VVDNGSVTQLEE